MCRVHELGKSGCQQFSIQVTIRLPSAHIGRICRPVSLPACLSSFLSAYQLVCLSACLHISLCVFLPVCISVCLSSMLVWLLACVSYWIFSLDNRSFFASGYPVCNWMNKRPELFKGWTTPSSCILGKQKICWKIKWYFFPPNSCLKVWINSRTYSTVHTVSGQTSFQCMQSLNAF